MSLDTLRNEILSYGNYSSEYAQKMIHAIPDAKVVDREVFILARCKGKIVLNIGCASGTLHSRIRSVASGIYGIDKESCEGSGFLQLDLDCEVIPVLSAVEVVICGEVLEHLSNPGQFLRGIQQYNCPIILTVPNAFSSVALSHLKEGQENVNIDHVCWYSWRSLTTLVERYGYNVKEFFWYNGLPLTAEGLIFVVQGGTTCQT